MYHVIFPVGHNSCVLDRVYLPLQFLQDVIHARRYFSCRTQVVCATQSLFAAPVPVGRYSHVPSSPLPASSAPG
jgi:hypothetical protein